MGIQACVESGEVTAAFCGIVAVNASRSRSVYGGWCMLEEIGGDDVDVDWSVI